MALIRVHPPQVCGSDTGNPSQRSKELGTSDIRDVAALRTARLQFLQGGMFYSRGPLAWLPASNSMSRQGDRGAHHLDPSDTPQDSRAKIRTARIALQSRLA